MSYSFKLNNIDLGIYGLTVSTSEFSLGVRFEADIIQLPDIALAAQSTKTPKPIGLGIVVQATSREQLFSYLDSIKGIVVFRGYKQLILDTQSDRYWTVRFEEMEGRLISPTTYMGRLLFVADDPLAYDKDTESTEFPILHDSETVEEVVGGTAYVNPVYTLLSGENLGAITLKVENVTLGEELQYKGTVGDDKTVIIDTEHWVVTLEGSEDMAEVTGKFPRLQPGVSNSIKVTGFSTTGTLTIAYRKAYL